MKAKYRSLVARKLIRTIEKSKAPSPMSILEAIIMLNNAWEDAQIVVTLKEETFAISRFLAKFAKVCSSEIFVKYKSRKFILARKKKEF